MDERFMHLMSLIADQVQTQAELFQDEGRIMDSLVNSGYRLHEADAALTLMQSLSRSTSVPESAAADVRPAPMRAMNTEERGRFSIDSFSFITKLAVLGVITEDQREDLIEKALTLHRGRIALEEVKALLAVDLFADAQYYEDLLASAQERSGAMWN